MPNVMVALLNIGGARDAESSFSCGTPTPTPGF